ncbi:MAG TPA: hypothetical protein VFV23_05645 [Verrucomicrobiae bacterium]|nr:hypothetical protein [Verrucomicrobiae bacterium]
MSENQWQTCNFILRFAFVIGEMQPGIDGIHRFEKAFSIFRRSVAAWPMLKGLNGKTEITSSRKNHTKYGDAGRGE